MEKAKETGTDQELMRSMKVSKAVAAMAIPSVISSLVTVVYNMADTFFVGQTGDALQVAAVSLTNPIFILLMAFANMFGMGGSAVASMAMGEGKPKKVKNTTAFITYASLAVGIIIAVILFAFMSPILHIFGANTETYEYAKGYIHYIAWGAPFIIWSAAASFVVRAEGASKEAMIGSMVGTIANIVLDPLFISGLHMGAAGAAIATTIGNILASLYFVWYFLKRSGQLSILPKDFTLGENIPQRVCTTGFPTAIFYASGRPPDPAALHPAADRRIRRRDIRSGNYRLYRGGPFSGILEKYKKKAVGFARVTRIILQLKNEIPAGVRSQSAVRHFLHITGD